MAIHHQRSIHSGRLLLLLAFSRILTQGILVRIEVTQRDRGAEVQNFHGDAGRRLVLYELPDFEVSLLPDH